MGFVKISDALAQTRQKRPWPGGVIIYALVDPRDSGVRYVGKTANSMRERLELHLKHPTNWDMASWLKDLRLNGRRPQISVLEYVETREWEDAERGWIFWFRDRGELLNIDPGGNYRHRGGKMRGVVLGEYSPPGGPQEPKPRPAMMTRLRRHRAPVWDRVNFPMGAK